MMGAVDGWMSWWYRWFVPGLFLMYCHPLDFFLSHPYYLVLNFLGAFQAGVLLGKTIKHFIDR